PEICRLSGARIPAPVSQRSLSAEYAARRLPPGARGFVGRSRRGRCVVGEVARRVACVHADATPLDPHPYPSPQGGGESLCGARDTHRSRDTFLVPELCRL